MFFVGSIFFVIIHRGLDFYPDTNWDIWAITIWAFLFVLHFIRVFITDSFMNKNWEREQIDRLVALQQKRISQLESSINEENENKI